MVRTDVSDIWAHRFAHGPAHRHVYLRKEFMKTLCDLFRYDLQQNHEIKKCLGEVCWPKGFDTSGQPSWLRGFVMRGKKTSCDSKSQILSHGIKISEFEFTCETARICSKGVVLNSAVQTQDSTFSCVTVSSRLHMYKHFCLKFGGGVREAV